MAQEFKYKNTQEPKKEQLVFGKMNYQLFLASIGVVILGFILMSGTTDIYSFTKITLAPIIVVGGFILGIVAILTKRKKPEN
ncbi:PEP-CTERM protein-sorting domain-containing protein [bacterium A37T11]|nr:PEP-CTERM protein-sorting domain-containing protein [bacterium A37T11]